MELLHKERKQWRENSLLQSQSILRLSQELDNLRKQKEILQEKLLKSATQDQMKKCNTCNENKDLKNFYCDKKTKKHKARCTACNSYAALQRNRKLGITPKEKPIINGKKECVKCHQMVEIKYFWKDKSVNTQNNLAARCISCKSKDMKNWRDNNKEQIILKSKMKWKNMSQLDRLASEKKKKFWRDNTEGGKKFKKRKSEEGKKRYFEIKNDPVAYNLKLEKDRKYETERRKNNPQFRLKQNLSRRVRGALTKFKTKKNISTLELTGINNIQSLMHYIAKQFKCDLKGKPMTWGNYGEWHIDHIKPCASFDLKCPIQQKKCFHYTNLQPLWAIDNLKKHAKLNYEDK